MTRSNHGRSVLALRATDGNYHNCRYRLFVRPFKEDTVTEYDIIETRYCFNEQNYASHANHSMLYLAVDTENSLRQGVLEINGDSHYQSLWIVGGHEHLLEEIPRIDRPASKTKPLPLPNHIIEYPEAI
ncbi:MAG: hypothetical protein H6797_00780 [Candidatus Nomurabacteria bacterium]|nr:MAG: hypothetical protein H6797_00780 [Candidatus Nomurabacteria bacterium]